MSWFRKLRSRLRRKKARVDRGLLIPLAPTPEPEPTPEPTSYAAKEALVPMIRPTMALAVVAGLCLVVYAQAAQFTETRLGLTQSATPAVVTSDTWPYQQRELTPGPLPALSDESYFASLKSELARTHDSFLALDTEQQTLTVYQAGTEALVAPIANTAAAGSWRRLAAGYYTIGTHQAERYSSLEQAYYPHVLTINQRSAIHGTPYKNDGTPAEAASLGITLRASDATALAAFATSGTPVLVRTSSHVVADTPALTPRGPILGVRGYGVFDLKTEAPLAAHHTNTVQPIASLTKLMTALVVAETYDLEGEIEIHQEQYASSLVPRLEQTTRTSVYNLLQLLLLESSNEAAEVLASHIGRDAFIARMNERAEALALTNTTFADPSGISAENVSTVADLYTLTQYIYDTYPFLLTLTATDNAVAAARENDFSNLENFNTIAGIDTFVGGKIGETEAARQTSVTVHELTFGTTIRPVVIIVLGSEARSADVTTLHNFILNRYGS